VLDAYCDQLMVMLDHQPFKRISRTEVTITSII